MARPVDWSPLAEQDPVPGDVEDIRRESKRLGGLATMISEQVERLQAIGRDTNALKGRYADSLRDQADELAGRLGKTHHRYNNVSGYLGHWADDLEDCQKQADEALEDATEAQRRVDAHQPPETGGKPDDHTPTEAERHAETTRRHALERAEDDLGDARHKLDKAVGHRDERAGHWAGKIRRCISRDGLHDKGWDKFKDWVSDHSRLLNDLANVLCWVATACAVIALFIPGLNIIAMIALGATLGALLLHSTTALAGEGSWIDVGLDVFALATMGLGRLAGPGMKAAEKGVRTAMRGAGAIRLGKAAWNAAKLENLTDLSRAGNIFRNGVKGSEQWKAAQKMMSGGMKAMWAAKKGALADAKALSGKALPEMGALKNLLGGGPEAASLRAYLNGAASRFPESTRIAGEIAKGAGSIRLSQGAFFAGTAVDSFDKAVGMVGPYFNEIPKVGGDNFWTDTKGWATVETGSTW
ncbi:putative T7SS-secreted protein [Streptomyces sp. NPDC048566]|uniref:putative T7SS-secreted protein n=1 Tax=Streptomyces sp. NPDC048566 TaxID=3365569 RepID=UPI003722F779